MHFFDPTLDWPPELISEEIPDLIYLKSNHPLDLSNRLHFSDPPLFVSSSTPWIEYNSIDGVQFLALLFIDVDYVQQQQAAGQIQSLVQDLVIQNVEIGRYRKMRQASSTSSSSSPGTTFQVWCWAFRSVSRQSLRASLTSFETFARAAASSTLYTQSTVYRQIASEVHQSSMSTIVPHSLLIHHFDSVDHSLRAATYSQEMLQQHSTIEKTLLAHSANQQLAFTSNVWTDAMPLLS